MKKIFYPLACSVLAFAVSSCNNSKQQPTEEQNDSIVSVTDSAIYGVVGEGTTMHVLEVITEEGKNVSFAVNQDSLSDIQGGIFAGDRITLVTNGKTEDDMPQVGKLINLTTLLGKWISLDRNFEIKEDGVVESSQKAESNPYTQWSMVNSRLVLNVDTFDIIQLGSDSLALENSKGIFVYKRLGKAK